MFVSFHFSFLNRLIVHIYTLLMSRTVKLRLGSLFTSFEKYLILLLLNNGYRNSDVTCWDISLKNPYSQSQEILKTSCRSSSVTRTFSSKRISHGSSSLLAISSLCNPQNYQQNYTTVRLQRAITENVGTCFSRSKCPKLIFRVRSKRANKISSSLLQHVRLLHFNTYCS